MRNLPNASQRWTSKGRTVSKSLSHRNMYILTDKNGKGHAINTSEEVAVKMWPVDQPKENGIKTNGSSRKFGVIITDEVLPSSTAKSALQIDSLKEFINTKSL